jgi:hypothetical protein
VEIAAHESTTARKVLAGLCVAVEVAGIERLSGQWAVIAGNEAVGAAEREEVVAELALAPTLASGAI